MDSDEGAQLQAAAEHSQDPRVLHLAQHTLALAAMRIAVMFPGQLPPQCLVMAHSRAIACSKLAVIQKRPAACAALATRCINLATLLSEHAPQFKSVPLLQARTKALGVLAFQEANAAASWVKAVNEAQNALGLAGCLDIDTAIEYSRTLISYARSADSMGTTTGDATVLKCFGQAISLLIAILEEHGSECGMQYPKCCESKQMGFAATIKAHLGPSPQHNLGTTPRCSLLAHVPLSSRRLVLTFTCLVLLGHANWGLVSRGGSMADVRRESARLADWFARKGVPEPSKPVLDSSPAEQREQLWCLVFSCLGCALELAPEAAAAAEVSLALHDATIEYLTAVATCSRVEGSALARTATAAGKGGFSSIAKFAEIGRGVGQNTSLSDPNPAQLVRLSSEDSESIMGSDSDGEVHSLEQSSSSGGGLAAREGGAVAGAWRDDMNNESYGERKEEEGYTDPSPTDVGLTYIAADLCTPTARPGSAWGTAPPLPPHPSLSVPFTASARGGEAGHNMEGDTGIGIDTSMGIGTPLSDLCTPLAGEMTARLETERGPRAPTPSSSLMGSSSVGREREHEQADVVLSSLLASLLVPPAAAFAAATTGSIPSVHRALSLARANLARLHFSAAHLGLHEDFEGRLVGSPQFGKGGHPSRGEEEEPSWLSLSPSEGEGGHVHTRKRPRSWCSAGDDVPLGSGQVQLEHFPSGSSDVIWAAVGVGVGTERDQCMHALTPKRRSRAEVGGGGDSPASPVVSPSPTRVIGSGSGHVRAIESPSTARNAHARAPPPPGSPGRPTAFSPLRSPGRASDTPLPVPCLAMEGESEADAPSPIPTQGAGRGGGPPPPLLIRSARGSGGRGGRVRWAAEVLAVEQERRTARQASMDESMMATVGDHHAWFAAAPPAGVSPRENLLPRLSVTSPSTGPTPCPSPIPPAAAPQDMARADRLPGAWPLALPSQRCWPLQPPRHSPLSPAWSHRLWVLFSSRQGEATGEREGGHAVGALLDDEELDLLLVALKRAHAGARAELQLQERLSA